MKIIPAILFVMGALRGFGQILKAGPDDVVWHNQSKNAGESMPCGGGDIGLNVWVEHGDILFYIARSGAYDENNTLLKSGRMRITLTPGCFNDSFFRQSLILKNGSVEIEGRNKITGLYAKVRIWVDVFSPQIHVDITSNKKTDASVSYESWRYRDRLKTGLENNENAYKSYATGAITAHKDSISFTGNGILFFHRNNYSPDAFDVTIKQQGLDSLRSSMDNPIANLVSGGMITGRNLVTDGQSIGKYASTEFRSWKLKTAHPGKSLHVKITLQNLQTPLLKTWLDSLTRIVNRFQDDKSQRGKSEQWWTSFWSRSFIHIDQDHRDSTAIAWQAGRNFQLFRYMLACNRSGDFPTKFNGGLFTYDPVFIDSSKPYTPDFRNWGGSIFTAQNQRLVYYPMLKNGDDDLLQPQLNFYLKIWKNALLATHAYWPHEGARFTEQIENFGLSDMAEYGSNRPASSDKGVDYNPWLEYHWDTVLEFCLMMLESGNYSGKPVTPYLPFIISCVDFFDQHYQYLAMQRGTQKLDGNGHLIIYPGSAGETYKMAYNPISTVAGLQTIVKKMLALPEGNMTKLQHDHVAEILSRLPPLTYRIINGKPTLSPAASWERVNNEESPQLYPVFPWGIYGIGRPGIDTAINTWNNDSLVIKFRSYIGWKQDNIFAARLGLTTESARLTFLKLKDSERRFPAFWGPGFDWTPDHNWGGSGMIGLQEMLLQCVDDAIYVLPAWPKDIDVHFKLHASRNTTVECTLSHGKIVQLLVSPASRKNDITVPL